MVEGKEISYPLQAQKDRICLRQGIWTPLPRSHLASPHYAGEKALHHILNGRKESRVNEDILPLRGSPTLHSCLPCRWIGLIASIDSHAYEWYRLLGGGGRGEVKPLSSDQKVHGTDWIHIPRMSPVRVWTCLSSLTPRLFSFNLFWVETYLWDWDIVFSPLGLYN